MENFNNRLITISKPFGAIRVSDQISRTFQAGERIFGNTLQTTDPVMFTLDNMPWEADRETFLDSTEPLSIDTQTKV